MAALAASRWSDRSGATLLLASLLAMGTATDRALAAQALGELGEESSPLLAWRLGSEPAAEVRLGLCRALAGTEDGGARTMLERVASEDADPLVRAAARRALRADADW